MKLLMLFALLSVSSSQDLLPTAHNHNTVKRSYVCPPKFIRQGHRCYYFSKQALTWNEALFQCRDMHSNLAIIQNRNQDKLIRNFLKQKSLDPLERWLGGVYDWKKMAWKWAGPGKPLTFNGFPKESSETSISNEESLQWQCIIMDPALQFMWNHKSCIEKKHFICQTRLKTVTNRDKKKLQRQYKADEHNKLNEIPVPSLPDPDYFKNVTGLKHIVPLTYRFEVNENLSDKALYAYKSPELSKTTTKKLKTHNNRKRNPQRVRQVRNRRLNRKKPIKKARNMTFDKNIKWKTYHESKKLTNPLYPQPIVEEYNYITGK